MTPSLATTATPDPGLPWWAQLAPFVAAVVLAAAYLVECAWWPFARCRRCDGAGKHARSDGKVWRSCRRCKGSGKRLRTGRRVWNHFAKIRKDAT